MVDITIRGIDNDTYSSFSARARKKNVPIGTLVTKAMSQLLESEDDVYLIENVVELSVSKSDLESIERQVYFKNISSLSFDKSVNWETFSQCVAGVDNISKLSVSKSLSRFQVLTKCKNVGKIIPS